MEPTGTYIQLNGFPLEEGRAGLPERKAWRCIPAVGAAVFAAALVAAAVFGVVSSDLANKWMFYWEEEPEVPTWTPERCFPEAVQVPRVEDMSLEEKIGQMTQVDQLALGNGDDVTRYFIGSVLSGGGGSPYWGNKPEDWADLIDHFQAKASKTPLQIPIIYGIDAVHGHNNVYKATIFPHHVGLGATRDPSLVREVGAVAARETAATGIRWAFSPAVSVCRDPRWGRCYESFSEHTEVVQAMTAEIDGWQARPTDPRDFAYNVSGEIFVAATAKHFIGDGGTQGGQDQGNTVISEEELRRVHLPPYIDAIRKGVQTLMISYSSWNGLKMHGNYYLITKVLRDELGFDGVVVSDWEAINQLPGTYADQVRTSVNAGLDMIMVPTTYKEFITTLKREVLEGRVAMSRIDEAVRRILKLKTVLGLFENACAPRQLLPLVGSEQHRAVARRAVRESLVLLKNEDRRGGGSMFPLPLDGSRILVAGSHSNNIGLQCGGWTIEWQGGIGNITLGTTILQAIQKAAEGRAQVEHVEQPTGEEGADFGVVVVGEEPYAETSGDRAALHLTASSHEAIERVCDSMPCIVILISGRPLRIKHLLPKIDALIAAWLPGSEGDGIADALFGNGDFEGRLPVTWFPEAAEAARSADNDPAMALFPFGFGLNKEGEQLSQL